MRILSWSKYAPMDVRRLGRQERALLKLTDRPFRVTDRQNSRRLDFSTAPNSGSQSADATEERMSRSPILPPGLAIRAFLLRRVSPRSRMHRCRARGLPIDMPALTQRGSPVRFAFGGSSRSPSSRPASQARVRRAARRHQIDFLAYRGDYLQTEKPSIHWYISRNWRQVRDRSSRQSLAEPIRDRSKSCSIVGATT
jgi:hypothetical protein